MSSLEKSGLYNKSLENAYKNYNYRKSQTHYWQQPNWAGRCSGDNGVLWALVQELLIRNEENERIIRELQQKLGC